MSPVVVVRAGAEPEPPALEHPGLPRRVRLDLAELVAAARLAGDVPLPLRLDAATGRLADRLSGGATAAAAAQVEDAVARASDAGPTGAVAALAQRGLVREGELDAGVAYALRVLAGGTGFVQVDLSQVRAHGAVALRSWLGIEGRLVAQLSTSGGADFELAWFDAALWHSQVTRTVTLDEDEAVDAVPLPGWVSLPTELFLGARKAIAEQRPDLVAGMVQAYEGQVLVADGDDPHHLPHRPHALPPDQAAGLLAVLVQRSVGRLRVLCGRRHEDEAPAVLSWVRFADAWHEITPGPSATTLLRRRSTAELSTLLEPFAADVVRGARSGGDER